MLILAERVGLSLVFAAFFALVTHVGVAVLFGSGGGWPLQTLSQPRVTFVDEAMRAVLYTPRLGELKRPMILVVGGSAGQEAYPPANIAKLAPRYDAHNLALGGPNMHEVAQVMEQVVRSSPPAQLRKSVVVISMTYTMYSPDAVRWRNPHMVSPSEILLGGINTDMDRAVIRNPLLSDARSWFGAHPPVWLDAALTAHYRSYLELSNHLPRGITMGRLPLRWQLWAFDPRTGRSLALDAPTGPETAQEARVKELDLLDRVVGRQKVIPYAEQFGYLKQTIAIAHGAGMRVAVVNMPLTDWHMAAKPNYAAYRAFLNRELPPLVQSGQIEFLDLEGTAPESEFRDGSHPTPEASMHWTRVLVSRLGLGNRRATQSAEARDPSATQG